MDFGSCSPRAIKDSWFIYLGIVCKCLRILSFGLCRLLQISSFNGKMNALNEVNKVITNVSFHASRHTPLEEDEWLTAEKMAVSTNITVTIDWNGTENTLTGIFRWIYSSVCSKFMFESHKMWPSALPFCDWQSVSVMSWTRLAGGVQMSSVSWATRFLFVGEEWTHMVQSRNVFLLHKCF